MSHSTQPGLDPLAAFGADTMASVDAADLRQRQRAVILAYSRRSIGRGEPSRLMLDAASLIGETLQVPTRGTVDRVDAINQWRLQIRLPGGEPIEHRYPADTRHSLAAFAFGEGRPVACANLATETRFKDLFLRQNGVVSALLLPLKIDERVFGAIGVFDRQPREFHIDDIEFADTIAHLLLSTMARLDVAQAFAAERQTLSTVLETAESLVILTDLAGGVLRVNKAAERVTGYSYEELARRPLWEAIATPAELAEVRQNFARQLETGELAAYESSLLTKKSETRRVRWSQAVMRDELGSPRTVVLTGIDVTELALLERQLQAAHKNADPDQAGPKTAPDETGSAPQASGAAFQVVDDPGNSQLRSSPRRAYPYRQSVAPFMNGQLPSKSDFRQVQFRDISAGGVSFVTNQRPNFEFLVLQLGCDANVHYMSARVVNSTEMKTADGPMFMVGCRFLERVHLK